MTENIILLVEYAAWVSDLKKRRQIAQQRATLAVKGAPL